MPNWSVLTCLNVICDSPSLFYSVVLCVFPCNSLAGLARFKLLIKMSIMLMWTQYYRTARISYAFSEVKKWQLTQKKLICRCCHFSQVILTNNGNDFSHYRPKLFSFFYFLLHFRSESPSQAILFLIEWILVTLQTFQRTNGVRSSYHMTCAMWMQSMSHGRLCAFIHLLTSGWKQTRLLIHYTLLTISQRVAKRSTILQS